MDNDCKRKRKGEVYKVTLKPEKPGHEVPGVQLAFFPYVPYPEQVGLIKSIGSCILGQENAIIESPTGTGKTLCLLVGALSSMAQLTVQNAKVPKVYYLTRTHSQITQVINEFKRLNWYSCKANIIASRDHLCINRNLKQLKGRMLDRGCQQLCKQKLCKYKEETNESASLPLKQWLTLEQLCQRGNKNKFCPFYYNKMVVDKCEVTVLPYNYLLDWNLMERNNFNLKNSVIIFDEAHNVDSLAQEGSSLEIDTQILAYSLNQLKILEQSSKCRYLHKKFQDQFQDSDTSYLSFTKSLVQRFHSSLKEFNYQKNISDYSQILQTIKKMSTFVSLDQIQEGIDMNNYQQIFINFEKTKKLFSAKKVECQHFESFYTTLFRIVKILEVSWQDSEDYYLSIDPKNKHTSMKLSCLNASLTFRRLIQQKPRSIILCSGTLGPFEIWQKQLGIPFKTKVRLPSFITPHQIRTDIIGRSSEQSEDIRFEFSYQHKNREEQFEALAKELTAIEKVVPNGIVVAFSTYELMTKAMRYCISLKKQVFFETKNENVEQIYAKYSCAARKPRGAFLFIVMKGKLSEGVNFADELCRCLIVVGIPFLPPNDIKVVKKKSYITSKFGKDAADQWYYSQTFKAVNQVIGRVIRSKKDYGVVLLFDQRYSRKDILKEMPEWFTANISEASLGTSSKYHRIKDFFENQRWAEGEKGAGLETSFEVALSKTVACHKQNSIGLQVLLNQDTPVKPNRPKKKLMITSDESPLPSKDNSYQPQHSATESKSKRELQLEQLVTRKKNIFPWLSVDYFLDQKQNLLQDLNKSPQSESMTNIQKHASLSIEQSRPKKKSYL